MNFVMYFMIYYKRWWQSKSIDNTTRLPKAHAELLNGTIYHSFGEETLLDLSVEMFSRLFPKDYGRPIKDHQLISNLFVFKTILYFIDAEIVQAYYDYCHLLQSGGNEFSRPSSRASTSPST